MMIQVRLLVLGILALVASACSAQYEYRFIEGETYSRGQAQGLREEGFTSWMAHPSGGKVVVFGAPADGFVEYDIEGLGEGQYWLYFRCLAYPSTKTHVLWDGQEIGMTTHDAMYTALRWSAALGPVQGAGKHVLRLQTSPDSGQTPYLDVLLLTNAPGYVPPVQDQDFVSLKTPWPVLQFTGSTPRVPIAPLPAAQAEPANLTVQTVTMGEPTIGDNALTLTLLSPVARTVTVQAAFADLKPDQTTADLAANQPQTISLKPRALRAGPVELKLTLLEANKPLLTGAYPVVLPALAVVTMDEYAYPSTMRAGLWSATLNCSPDLLPAIKLSVAARDLATGKTFLDRSVPAAPKVEVPFDVASLPVGRFEIVGRIMLEGQEAQRETREFSKFDPVQWPAWEPIRESKAVGDTIMVNGKPFLARMLYHAPMDETIVNHGFNVVQCFGSDPDPLPSIKQHLDACEKVGLYGAVALFNNQFFNKGPEFDLARLEQAVMMFKDHPALLCWDLIDEPEGTMTPEAVQAGADLIRRLDPNHFVWVNMCQYPRLTDYLASQDLWSYDYYPFPQQTPFVYKERWINLTDEKLLGKKPLGTCLQTYNYNQAEWRMPSPDETRTSAWLHVIHGYKWFGYYSYYDAPPSGCLSRDPMLLSYTRALNTELVQLQDVIVAPGQWREVKLEPANPKLEAREKEVNGKLYVVVVSDSRDPQTVTLQPSWPNAKRQLLIETEMKPLTGEFSTTIRPVGTQVWELTR